MDGRSGSNSDGRGSKAPRSGDSWRPAGGIPVRRPFPPGAAADAAGRAVRRVAQASALAGAEGLGGMCRSREAAAGQTNGERRNTGGARRTSPPIEPRRSLVRRHSPRRVIDVFGPDTFVVRVDGDDMAPRLRRDDFVHVDADASEEVGRLVAVRDEESGAIAIRQLVEADGRRALRALDGDRPGRVPDVGGESPIRGVVVFRGRAV